MFSSRGRISRGNGVDPVAEPGRAAICFVTNRATGRPTGTIQEQCRDGPENKAILTLQWSRPRPYIAFGTPISGAIARGYLRPDH
jgi:hypothetical protein